MISNDEDHTTGHFYPLKISQSTNTEHQTVNVILIENDDTMHFVLIKASVPSLEAQGQEISSITAIGIEY